MYSHMFCWTTLAYKNEYGQLNIIEFVTLDNNQSSQQSFSESGSAKEPIFSCNNFDSTEQQQVHVNRQMTLQQQLMPIPK